MENHSKSRKVIASVQHALQILDLFNGTCSELGNVEIAKALNMDPSTVAGLVYTLKLNKYLDQNLTNRKYRLGLKLVERASTLLRHIDLRKIATPYLEELLKWSSESVNLGIRDQYEVVYIERLFGDHALGVRSELGKRAPLHSTALGKAILAHMDINEARVILANYEFVPVTRYTITDQKQFQSEMEHIRDYGFAIDEQENEIGGRCIAAPIYNNDGDVIAAVSISVPIQRLPNGKIAAYGEKIKAAALEISRNIGYIRK
jgi:IclR family KDG regulon transcriptional repressor